MTRVRFWCFSVTCFWWQGLLYVHFQLQMVHDNLPICLAPDRIFLWGVGIICEVLASFGGLLDLLWHLHCSDHVFRWAHLHCGERSVKLFTAKETTETESTIYRKACMRNSILFSFSAGGGSGRFSSLSKGISALPESVLQLSQSICSTWCNNSRKWSPHSAGPLSEIKHHHVGECTRVVASTSPTFQLNSCSKRRFRREPPCKTNSPVEMWVETCCMKTLEFLWLDKQLIFVLFQNPVIKWPAFLHQVTRSPWGKVRAKCHGPSTSRARPANRKP